MIRKFLKDEKGTAIIEMACLIPLILILIFGYIFFLNGIKDQLVMRTAAREAARLYANPYNDGENKAIDMGEYAKAKAYFELSRNNIKGATVKVFSHEEKRYVIIEKPFITRLPKMNLKQRAGAVFYSEPVDVIIEE